MEDRAAPIIVKSKQYPRALRLAAALSGGLGVALAARAAHFAHAAPGADDSAHLAASLARAADMLMMHAPALLAIAQWQQHAQPAAAARLIAWAGAVLALGVAVFALSVSLHVFGLTAHAPLAPLGGTAAIAGWLLLAVAAWRAG